MTEINDIVEGEISGMAFGGQGILRHQGLVVFVPYAAQNDVIKCSITRKKASYAEGTLLQVIKPSPERTAPLCPYFGTCGGCQLQHINYQAQTEHKRLWLKDALERIGGFRNVEIAPIVPATLQWAYRRHVTLSLQRTSKGYKGGYIANDGLTLIQIDQCPIFIDPTNRLFQEIHPLLGELECAGKEEGRLTIMKVSDEAFTLYFQFKSLPGNFAKVFQKAFKFFDKWEGVLARSASETIKYGQVNAKFELEGMSFQYSPTTFVQNHPEQSLNIYRKVLSLALESHPKAALDLYCGIGVTSLLMAKSGIKVQGVEYSPEAVKIAKVNALNNKITNVDFVKGDVGRLLKGLVSKLKPELILVNPPREGLGPEVIKGLLEAKPEQIIYVSCMPATLARDLKKLVGYRVTYCEPYDMFPQTTHLETIVRLVKGS